MSVIFFKVNVYIKYELKSFVTVHKINDKLANKEII